MMVFALSGPPSESRAGDTEVVFEERRGVFDEEGEG